VQPTKKVVSRAQYRLFRDARRRIEAGGESLIKNMTLADICYALEGVDYDALPERSGRATPKPRRQPKAPTRPTPPPPLPPQPEPLPDDVLSFEAYRACHPEKVLPVVDQGELAHILSFDGYVRRHPEVKRRGLPSKVGHEWFAGLFR
jgi:hypothetical protein